MRKLTTLVLMLSGLGMAATIKPANCTKATYMTTGAMNYTSLAKFPEPEENIELDFLSKTTPVPAAVVCGVTFKVNPKAQTITVTAPKLDTLAKVLSSFDKGQLVIPTYMPDGMGHAATVKLKFDLRSSMLSMKAASDDVVSTTTVGVKVDSGALQPLFYNGKMTPIRISPSAKTFDIYVKVPAGTFTGFERINVNLKNSAVVLYKEAAFPAK